MWADYDQSSGSKWFMASPTQTHAMATILDFPAGQDTRQVWMNQALASQPRPNFISLRPFSSDRRHLAIWTHVSSVSPKETQIRGALGLSGLWGYLEVGKKHTEIFAASLIECVFLWTHTLHNSLNDAIEKQVLETPLNKGKIFRLTWGRFSEVRHLDADFNQSNQREK